MQSEPTTVAIETFDPAGLPRGRSHRLWLRAFDLLASPLLLPTYVVNGAEPGRTLFTVAGVHGDEYEGMAAIRRVVARLDPAHMRGRLIAIPVANPLAYEARARIAPLHQDGLNLARVFPGDPHGSPTRMLAHRLLELVLRCVGPDELFLDFHSGSADVAFAPLIGFRGVPGAHTNRAEVAARSFGLERIWRIPDSQGPFNAETARRGIVTLGTETTGRAGCDPDDVAVYERGLWNLLAYLVGSVSREAGRLSSSWAVQLPSRVKKAMGPRSACDSPSERKCSFEVVLPRLEPTSYRKLQWHTWCIRQEGERNASTTKPIAQERCRRDPGAH